MFFLIPLVVLVVNIWPILSGPASHILQPPLPPEQAKRISMVANPRRQLKQFADMGAPIDSLEKVPVHCAMYCYGMGEDAVYYSPLPGNHILRTVDEIDLYCGTISYPPPTHREEVRTYDPLGFTFDDKLGNVMLTEQRSLLMDIPYGVYWIKTRPCGWSYDQSSIDPHFYGPYGVKQPLSLICTGDAKSVYEPCPDYSDELGSYTPPDYNCAVDSTPIVYTDIRQALMNPTKVCIYDTFQNRHPANQPEGRPGDVEKLVNVRVLRISRYELHAESVDQTKLPHLRAFMLE